MKIQDRAPGRDLTAILAKFGLFLAILGGLFAPVARFKGLINPSVSQAFVQLLASEIFLLFLVVMLNRNVRNAIDCANIEMKGGDGNDRYFKRRMPSLLDPRWGLFGHRLGGGLIKVTRAALFLEFFAMLFLNGKGPTNPALIAAGLAFGITLLVTMIQLRDHYPPHGEAGG